jgi:hypothetical protein
LLAADETPQTLKKEAKNFWLTWAVVRLLPWLNGPKLF